MPIASYSPPNCVECLDTVQQPVFGTVTGVSETKCSPPCGSTSSSAIPVPLLPDGTPWKVDYFLQVLSPGDSPAPIDHHLNPVFQRLAWLEDMTLFVTQPLSVTVDTDTNITYKTGEATFVGTSPEVGDAFIAYLEFNNAYLFRVTETQALTASGAKTYRIAYTAYSPIDNYEATLDDLSHKVATYDKYGFDISLYLQGKLPFTTAASVEAAIVATTTVDKLLSDWESFYDHDSACYVAIVDGKRVYDPYVNEAMQKITPVRRQIHAKNNMSFLWQRSVSQYRTVSNKTPYTTASGFVPLKLYDRYLSKVAFNLDHIRHTAIELFIHDGTSMPADDGEPVSNMVGTVLHAHGYVVGQYYGTTDPLKTAIDSLIEANFAGTVTPTLIAQAITQYNSLPLQDRYWVIPILLTALKA